MGGRKRKKMGEIRGRCGFGGKDIDINKVKIFIGKINKGIN